MSFLFKNFVKKSFCVRFSATHEWVKIISGKKAQIGISDHAKSELGEIVFVDLTVKNVGDVVKAQDEVCNLESVKAAAPVYTPVSGKLTKKNEDALNALNSNAEKSGWIWEIELSEENELKKLMTKEDYLKTLH